MPQPRYLSNDVGVTPDDTLLAAIASRLKHELGDGSVSDCPAVRRSISDSAHTLARDVYGAACANGATTPKEELPRLAAELEAQAAITGCRFATLVRRSVHPRMADDEPITDIERFAARRFWFGLINLIEAAHTGGSA